MRRLKLPSIHSLSSFCFYQVIYLYSDIPPQYIKTSQSRYSFIGNAATFHFRFLLKKNSNSQYFSL